MNAMLSKMIALVVWILDPYYSNRPRKPLETFRLRSLSVQLGITALITTVQTIIVIVRKAPTDIVFNYLLINLLALGVLYWLRFARNVELFSAVSLLSSSSVFVIVATHLGPHSYSALLTWMPSLVYFGILTSGRRYGRWVVWGACAQVIFTVTYPLLMGFAPFPASATSTIYHLRLFVVLLASCLFPPILNSLYHHFFQEAKDETYRVQMGLEKVHRKSLLTHLAYDIVQDMDAALGKLETVVAHLEDADAQVLRQALPAAIPMARSSIHAMSAATTRYRMLSEPPKESQGIALRDFLEELQNFKPEIRLSPAADLDLALVLLGDHVFTIQLILCLALSRSCSSLQITSTDTHLNFVLKFHQAVEKKDPIGDFMDEVRHMMDEMQGEFQIQREPDRLLLQLSVPWMKLGVFAKTPAFS